VFSKNSISFGDRAAQRLDYDGFSNLQYLGKDQKFSRIFIVSLFENPRIWGRTDQKD
jgi:hypothetical protein